jgi:hypothetical protein
MITFGSARSLTGAIMTKTLGGVLSGNAGVLQATVAELATRNSPFETNINGKTFSPRIEVRDRPQPLELKEAHSIVVGNGTSGQRA